MIDCVCMCVYISYSSSCLYNEDTSSSSFLLRIVSLVGKKYATNCSLFSSIIPLGERERDRERETEKDRQRQRERGEVERDRAKEGKSEFS